MRRALFTQSLLRKQNISNTLNTILNGAGHGYSSIYQSRLYSSESGDNTPIQYTKIKSVEYAEIDSFLILPKKLQKYPKGNLLDTQIRKILQVANQDISISPEDSKGQLVVFSKDDINIKYGERGVAASSSTTPDSLLTKDYKIPAQSFGVIDIQEHVPFRIDTRDEQSFVMSSSQLLEVPTYEESISRYSLSKIIEVPPETAKILSLNLQRTIYEDKNNEYFYEEVTSKQYPPTKYNRSSGTLMNFEKDEDESTKRTDSHYHPGERSLYIVTTNKSSGVTLNFCGIAESPDDRKDCEVKLEFPKNSLVSLNFPPYTHHKFRGEFVCMSIHPREGVNLIESLENGTLPRGFLESATVFSSKGDEENWKLSTPAPQISLDKEDSRGL